MKVRNIENTTPETCNCESWLEHWHNASENNPTNACSVKHCPEQADVGAHVYNLENPNDKQKYIVPMCYQHNNQRGQNLDLSLEEPQLVPDNWCQK